MPGNLKNRLSKIEKQLTTRRTKDLEGNVALEEPGRPAGAKPGPKTGGVKPRIVLDTLEASRATFARLIAAYAAGIISERQGRAFSYMLSAYLSYWRLLTDDNQQRDIDELKEAVARLRQDGAA